MSREGALLVMIGVAVVLLAVGLYAWQRRRLRDRGVQAPVGALPADAVVRGTYSALYVASTRHDEPLERLAIRGLAFRSRTEVTVTSAGVALDLPGQPRFVLTPDHLLDAAQATVAIDRVVERDGLTRLTWRSDDGTVVDSYLRPQETSARALADVIRPLTPTGTDA